MSPQARKAKSADSGAEKTNTEDILKPFHEAAQKFTETISSARENAFRQWMETCISLQEEMQRIEKEGHEAISAQNTKFFESHQAGQTAQTSHPQAAWMEHENAIRKIQTETQERLAATAEKLYQQGNGSASKELGKQQEDAFQEYVGNLQRAWGEAKPSDPQTLSAISFGIMTTMSAYCT